MARLPRGSYGATLAMTPAFIECEAYRQCYQRVSRSIVGVDLPFRGLFGGGSRDVFVLTTLARFSLGSSAAGPILTQNDVNGDFRVLMAAYRVIMYNASAFEPRSNVWTSLFRPPPSSATKELRPTRRACGGMQWCPSG